MTKTKFQNFTAQIKIVAVVDVEMKAVDFQAALEVAKGFKLTDILELSDNVTRIDDRTVVVGVFGAEAWDV